jgi:hypothetical protein
VNRHHAIARVAALVALVGAAACNDQNVPFLTAPTSLTNTPTGMSNGLIGLISASRNDVGGYVTLMAGFGRQAAVFTNTEPRLVTYNTGLFPMPNTWTNVWTNEYTNIHQAHDLLALVPQVEPTYSTAQQQALNGIIKTEEALNYMMIEEVVDTNGAAINQGGSGLPPAYCNKDVWQYIVSLLDSANAELDSAGATPLPVKLPSGFSAVSATAGPATPGGSSQGSFAAFNRALAAKAGLELAYAIARNTSGTAPSPPDNPGTPDLTALTRADSAMKASALFNPGGLSPNPTGGWTQDGFSVFHDFSSTSGDVVNPINANYTTYVMLAQLINEIEPGDARFTAKFTPIPAQYLPVQQPSYNIIAAPYFYSMYQSPGAYIPIVRNEELTLVEAEIQLGLGNTANAWTLVNDVRTEVAGLSAAPGTGSTDFGTTRDAIMHEIQVSTANEASGDYDISIRMYGLAAVIDTTWNGLPPTPAGGDSHTTISPIPYVEVSGRGGTWTTTCP